MTITLPPAPYVPQVKRFTIRYDGLTLKIHKFLYNYNDIVNWLEEYGCPVYINNKSAAYITVSFPTEEIRSLFILKWS